MGQKQSKILKESFRKQGLKMNKPQEPKTPEKWLEGYMKTFNMRNANATINLDE